VTKKVIEAAPKLRVVGPRGPWAWNNIDVEGRHPTRPWFVMNTPGGNTITTAELTFTMLLNLARKVPQAYASMVRRGNGTASCIKGVETSPKKPLGVLGHGAASAAKVAQARRRVSGCACLAYDPFFFSRMPARKPLGVELGRRAGTPSYRGRGFLSPSTWPVTEQTKGMLNAAGLRRKMKPKVCHRQLRPRRNHCRERPARGNGFWQGSGSGFWTSFATEPLPGRPSVSQTRQHRTHARISAASTA